MQPAMLFMLQAVTGTSIDTFDLRKLPPAHCGDPGPDIVVCGRRRSYALTPLPKDVEDKQEEYLPRAEVKVLGKGTLSLDATPKKFNGAVSNRAMITLKLPF